MNKGQRATINAFGDMIATYGKKIGVEDFRYFLRDTIPSLPTELQVPALKMLIDTFDGQKHVFNSHTDSADYLRDMLGEIVGEMDDSSGAAQFLLSSNLMARWDLTSKGTSEGSRFTSYLHSLTPNMTLVHNTRKLGTMYLTHDIADNYEGTPERAAVTVFARHGADGLASIFFRHAHYAIREGEFANIMEYLNDKKAEATEQEKRFGWGSAESRLGARKQTRAANNTAIYAANDLCAFFGESVHFDNRRVTTVNFSPLSQSVVNAAAQIVDMCKPLADQSKLRSQPYIGSGFGGAL